MKYRVHIVEMVEERHYFDIEADSELEAAKIASARWLIDGDEGDKSHEYVVDDREYLVFEGGNDDIVANAKVFDTYVVEGEGEE